MKNQILTLAIGATIILAGIVVVKADLNCQGVTNTNTTSPPCVKTEYVMGSNDWNCFCTSGSSGACADGSAPGSDVTVYTYTGCNGTSDGGVDNGLSPKSKTCN
jgi:trans-2-enoyl-CoA reductase